MKSSNSHPILRRLGGPALAAAWGLSLLAGRSVADTVHMKGGRDVTGIINQEESDEEFVVIRTTNGVLKINRKKVEKIEVRQEMSDVEKQGDLAASQGDLDAALRFYLRAYAAEPDNKNLETKIANMKSEIKKRDDRRFGLQFEKIEKAITGERFAEAIDLGTELQGRVKEESVRQRCKEKICQAYILQARNFRNTVSYPQAEQAYRKGIEAYPGGAVASLELAELIERYPTRKAESYDFYKQGLELARQDPTLVDKDELLRYRFNSAKLLLDKTDYRQAALDFWDVVKLDPKEKYPKAIEYIVRCYETLQKDLSAANPANDQAVAVLKGVAERRPLEDKPNFILGVIYYNRQDYAQARKYLDAAIKNMTSTALLLDVADGNYYLADSMRKTGDDRGAIDKLKKTLSIQPARYVAVCDLGDIYFELGEYPNALDRYRNGVEIEPDTYRAYYGAGRTLRRMEKFAEAIVMYEQLVKLKDDEPQYFFELGLSYTAIERFEDARATYLKVLELLKKANDKDPKIRDLYADSYMNLAQSNYALKRHNEAIENYDQALVYRPGYPKAIAAKGQTYLELGDLKQAEKCYHEAAKADPKDPEFELKLGVLFQRYRKDSKGALPYYAAYYEKGGKDPQVRQWIIECGGTPP